MAESKLQYIPALKFKGDAPLTQKEMQRAHEQNILEQERTLTTAENAKTVDIGVFEAGMDISHLAEGQSVMYTLEDGTEVVGKIRNGRLMRFAVMDEETGIP